MEICSEAYHWDYFSIYFTLNNIGVEYTCATCGTKAKFTNATAKTGGWVLNITFTPE